METEQRVVVVDVNMKFSTMVWFLVKLAIASIPAAVILFVIGILLSAIFGGLFGGFASRV